jgi:hypothetical protein
MTKLVLALAALGLLTGSTALGAVKTPPPSDWAVTTTLKSAGAPICQLRMSTPANSPTLSLSARPAKTGYTVRAPFFSVGGLPPLLTAKGGPIYGFKIVMGDWSKDKLRGNWSHGNADNNSSVSFQAGQSINGMLPYLKDGAPVTVAFHLGTHSFSYSFSLAGITPALAVYKSCLDLAAAK